MKHLSIILGLHLLAHCAAFAQPDFNPVEKGNTQANIQLMLTPTDLFWSETALNISKDTKMYGLHLAGGYNWFIENGWSLGVQAHAGVLRERRNMNDPWGYENNVVDIALAPITRYYFNIGRKHRFKPFLFAALPVVFTSDQYKNNSPSFPYSRNEQTLALQGSLGFGAAYFGRKGSLELHLSNMGFNLGLSRYRQRSIPTQL
jgi:hypothetical protein